MFLKLKLDHKNSGDEYFLVTSPNIFYKKYDGSGCWLKDQSIDVLSSPSKFPGAKSIENMGGSRL